VKENDLRFDLPKQHSSIWNV